MKPYAVCTVHTPEKKRIPNKIYYDWNTDHNMTTEQLRPGESMILRLEICWNPYRCYYEVRLEDVKVGNECETTWGSCVTFANSDQHARQSEKALKTYADYVLQNLEALMKAYTGEFQNAYGEWRRNDVGLARIQRYMPVLFGN